MKYMQTLIIMAVSGVVLAFAGSAVAQTVKPCVVTVVRIQGQARYSEGDNVWHPLLVGKVLGSGAIIQSAVNSTVDIVLSGDPVLMPQAASTPDTISYAPDPNVRGLVSYKPMVQQNVIRLWGNTVLAVDKLTQFNTGVDTISDTELDLRAGRIFFNLRPMSHTSQFIIKIPDGVAGIRDPYLGSWGTLDAQGDMAMGGGSAVESIVFNGKPYTVDIEAGHSFSPSQINLSNANSSNNQVTMPLSQKTQADFELTRISLISLFQSPNGPPNTTLDSINLTREGWVSTVFGK